MTISNEAYQALEDIVGPDNVSREPAILDSYSWMWENELLTQDCSGFDGRPGAVLLPGSTEEVQAVVRACNRYGMKVKPFSTGWVTPALASGEDAINMDLRRMNRILEIDEKNMFVVVEPYAVGAQIQSEVMKLGLNVHLTGAGAGCSPLASATSLSGSGPDSLFMGRSNEVLLAVEWVMPNGDILRTGSLGSGMGWFCGEGPGPSLRGIFRGRNGANGGMGVFTKVALKLSPWPGPPELPVEGIVPAYNMALPGNFRFYTLALPSWKAYADAYYKIYDAEIGYICHRQFSMLGEDLGPAFWMMYKDPTKSLDDLEDFVNKPEIKALTEEMRHYSFQIILAGQVPGEIEYQEKALDQILAETGGHKVAAMSEPDMERFALLYFVRLPSKHLNNVLAGGRQGTFAQRWSPDLVTEYGPIAAELLRKHQESGRLVTSGGDSMMGPMSDTGGGGVCAFEQFLAYARADMDSVLAARDFCADARKVARELQLGRGNEGELTEGVPKAELQARLAAAPQPARFHWQWKIKQMLDPNDAADSNSYQMLEKLPKK
jgi:hypothetical protein